MACACCLFWNASFHAPSSIAVKLWVSDSDTRQLAIVSMKGFTDNKSNESLVRKGMTTKFPSTLILMELMEELGSKNSQLELSWLRRDSNQLADDLTNEKKSSTVSTANSGSP